MHNEDTKLKILLAGSLPLAAPWNGADKNLAQALARADTQNTYLVHTGPEDEWPAHVVPVRTHRAGAMPTRTEKLRAFAFMLRHARGADIIHVVATVNRPSPWMARLLRAVARLAGRPLIHTAPSIGDALAKRAHFPGDVTVVVSEHTRQRLEHIGVPAVARIFPPLGLEGTPSDVALARLRAALNLGERAVLYPTHYGPDSGIREMIAAFADLPAAFADAVLVLACRAHAWQDADQEARQVAAWAAEAGIADRVRITGPVEDMVALIAACAVTALVPRKLAGKMDLPLVILEAQALGRPVIVSDHAPIIEALLGGGGVAVPYGDVAKLTGALAELLEDSAMRTRLGAAGQEAVLAHCNPERVAAQYRLIYAAALAATRADHKARFSRSPCNQRDLSQEAMKLRGSRESKPLARPPTGRPG
jgi:glycosyltransferase involved in cell wall biosynthesis